MQVRERANIFAKILRPLHGSVSANARTASRRLSIANRNAIERMFWRLKDFRRIATRYDRNAVSFLAGVCIAATLSYRL